MITNILLGITLAGIVYIGWRLSKGSGGSSERDQVMREHIENLRREIIDAKDKLNDGMGKNAENIQKRLEKTLELVNNQLGGMDTRIDKRVEQINKRLDSAAQLIGDVKKQYGTVESLSGDIKRLQEAFRAPKTRGGFGEKALVDLVARVLPVQGYKPQHKFKSGETVDLLVKTTNGDISIDAKFPLDNYLKLVDTPDDDDVRTKFRGDVKKHIKDIAKKYILPDEGTLDFALMFVPSDTVMFEIITDEELSGAAEQQNILILSPHSFYYFLNVIRLAHQGQQFEKNAKEILSLIKGVQQQSGKLGKELSTLQSHITNAANKMSDVQTSHMRLDMQIAQTNQLESGQTNALLKKASSKAMEQKQHMLIAEDDE